jgi:hypothetical protein
VKEFTFDISDCMKAGLRKDWKMRMAAKPRSLIRSLNMRPEEEGLSSRNRPLDPFALTSDNVGLGSVIAAATGGYGGGGPAGAGPAVDSGDLYGYPTSDPNYNPDDYNIVDGDPTGGSGDGSNPFTPPGIYGRSGEAGGGTQPGVIDDTSSSDRYGKWITADHNLEDTSKWEMGSRCRWTSYGLTYCPPEVAVNKIVNGALTSSTGWTEVPLAGGTITYSSSGCRIDSGYPPMAVFPSIYQNFNVVSGKSYTVTFTYISPCGVAFSEADTTHNVYIQDSVTGTTLGFWRMHGSSFGVNTFTFTAIGTNSARITITNDKYQQLNISNVSIMETGVASPNTEDPNGYIKQSVSNFLRPMPDNGTILRLRATGWPAVPADFGGSGITANLVMGSSLVSPMFFRKYIPGVGYSSSFWDDFSCPMFFWNDATGVLEIKLTFKTPQASTVYTPDAPILYLSSLGVLSMGIDSWTL